MVLKLTTIAFTLCSNNYLAQAKTLGDSLVKHNPEINFFIGLVDKRHPEVDYSFFDPHTILPFNEIGFNFDFDEMVSRYNIVEFNTSVKPFFFKYFGSKGFEKIFYIDPDIKVYSSFHFLIQSLDEFNFVLTPHKVIPDLEKVSPFETLVSNVGVYNFGFLGLKVNKETDKFLDWWTERLKIHCKIDFSNGLFVDQKWGDFIPALFDKPFVIKNPGYNVGYWNFDERVVSRSGDKFLVNDKFELSFFHFSNYNPLMPEKLCKWLDYSFDERPDLIDIYEEYKIDLLNNKYEVFEKLSPLLEFKKNHPHLDKNVEEKLPLKLSTKQKVGHFLKKGSNRLIKKVFNV